MHARRLIDIIYVLPTLQEPPVSLMQCEPDITVTNTPCHYIGLNKYFRHIIESDNSECFERGFKVSMDTMSNLEYSLFR